MKLERLHLLTSLYRTRLDAANANQRLLDDKARWLLTVTMPVSAALVAYISTGPALVLAPSALLIGFIISSILAAVSLLPRDYEVGIKVPANPDDYRVLLEGEDHRVVEFEYANIKEIANAVRVNEDANDRKGRWVQRAMWVGVLSPLIAAAFGLISLIIPFLCAAFAGVSPVSA